MSTGRQGFQVEAQQLHLEGHRLGARGGGVDALAEALEQSAQLGVEPLGLALGGAADAERQHQPIDRQALGPGHLGDPPRDDTTVEVHLPEAVLAVAEALGEPEVTGGSGGHVRHAPTVALDADRPIQTGERNRPFLLGQRPPRQPVPGSRGRDSSEPGPGQADRQPRSNCTPARHLPSLLARQPGRTALPVRLLLPMGT